MRKVKSIKQLQTYFSKRFYYYYIVHFHIALSAPEEIDCNGEKRQGTALLADPILVYSNVVHCTDQQNSRVSIRSRKFQAYLSHTCVDNFVDGKVAHVGPK